MEKKEGLYVLREDIVWLGAGLLAAGTDIMRERLMK